MEPLCQTFNQEGVLKGYLLSEIYPEEVLTTRSVLYAYPCICNAPKYLHMKLLRVRRRIFNIIGVKISPSVLEISDMSCSNLPRTIEKFPQHLLRCFFVSNHKRVTRFLHVTALSANRLPILVSVRL